jgi:ABC transport system ATP-binding/permease protein
MSERILKALMQLFAIVAKVDGVSNNGREVVQSFLKQQLSQELVGEYLKLFDDFLETHHNASSKKEGARKRTSVNSVKVLKICTQINSELTQKQKIVVLIRLIEFIHSGEITEQELEFVSTVADTFNIEEQEFSRCMSFFSSKVEESIDLPQVLVIDNNKENPLKQAKHLYSETLPGQLRVLFIPSVTMYAIRYYGSHELYLNGLPLIENRIYILTQGSSIRSPKVQPIYYSDIISCFMSDTSIAKITFYAKDIEYRFKKGNIGVQKMSLYEESGKLIGIMGGSGAGKSTLLNVLNGNEQPSSGTITINGFDTFSEKDKIEGVIGYVSQDDLLIEELTVFQNLFYNAKLCFDHLDDRQITKKVLDVLNDLGLFETRHLKVGSPLEKTISGGQRKRVNIALELIREPSVMFVDEPTSGLSSRDSENIMDLLKELALKGKLIFVVIHQPSSEIFKMFDKLFILDLGGYPIYYGNPVDAVIYFKTMVNHVNCNESECVACGNVNPEQIFNIIESKVVDEYGDLTKTRKISPKEWHEFYKENISSRFTIPTDKQSELPKISFKVPNKIKQFKVFITRDVLSKLTNTQYMLINLLEAPVLAIILAYLVKYYNADISNVTGYIFRENENLPAYLFMSVVVALFIGLTVSAEEIIRDRKILKRESFLNLSKSSYLFSKIAIMFFLSAIQTISFIIIANLILEISGLTLEYWLILFSTACFANMLGLNISSAFNSAVTIYILIPFLLIPQLLLSGVIVKFDKLNPTIAAENNVPFAGEVMVSRWAFEALAVTQFKDNKYERNFYEYDKIAKSAEFKKNFWIPRIKGKLDFIETYYKAPEKKEQILNDIELLKTEIEIESLLSPDVKIDLTNISFESFADSKLITSLRRYTDELNKHYIKKYNKADDKKDAIISKMTSTPEKKEEFIKLQNRYRNDNLGDLVTNRNELNKILEKNQALIQRSDPVYLDPVKSADFRAHFFAPQKRVFGKYYDTFWVNIFVIWAMSLSLVLTLYFNVFKVIIDGLSKLPEFIPKKKT